MPKFQPGTGRFQPFLEPLFAGQKVLITGFTQNQVSGSLGSYAAIKHKFVVRTRRSPEGIVAWLEPKTRPEHAWWYKDKETPMDMPTPKQNWDPTTSGKYGPALASLLEGNVIKVENAQSPTVVPGFSRKWISDQGFVIRSRNVDNDCVVWLAKR